MRKIEIETSKIQKSYHNGWTADTRVITPGSQKDYTITTVKGNKGALTSYAQPCTFSKNGNCTSFDIFGDPSINLISVTKNATEKTVKEQHQAAILVFEQKVEAEEIKIKDAEEEEAASIKVGQIIFTDWVTDPENNRRAIYEINLNGNFGPNYKAVNLETLILTNEDHIKPIEQKYGIGTYYRKSDTIEVNELNDLVIKAKEKAKNDAIKKEIATKKAEEETVLKIKAGKKIVRVPSWASSVIVAHHKVNQSDIQSDYHGHTTNRTIYLAFSKHDKDLFPEMKKAVLKCEETKHLSEAKENRHKYSMGSGYWLGEHSDSGWEARKENLNLNNLDYLYIAATESRYYCNEVEQTGSIEDSTEAIKNGSIELIQYSEKALAVLGETKLIKETLKGLGGRFNFRLTHPETGQKFAGWIFPLAKMETLKAELF